MSGKKTRLATPIERLETSISCAFSAYSNGDIDDVKLKKDIEMLIQESKPYEQDYLRNHAKYQTKEIERLNGEISRLKLHIDMLLELELLRRHEEQVEVPKISGACYVEED